MRSLHVDWAAELFPSVFFFEASCVKSLLKPASIGLSLNSIATQTALVMVTPPVNISEELLDVAVLKLSTYLRRYVTIPETTRLARQSKCSITQVAKKGQRDPETLEEAESALQNVPNCSGLNHYI